MVERSLYSQIIKNENSKVRASTGIYCTVLPPANNTAASEENNKNIELLRNILTDNGNCSDISGENIPCVIPVIRNQSGSGNCGGNAADAIGFRNSRVNGCGYIQCGRRYSRNDTNICRFLNSDLPGNFPEYSNDGNISNRTRIEQILKRYGRR